MHAPRLYNFLHAQFNCSKKLKYWKIKTFLAFIFSDVAFIMLINVKMQTIIKIFVKEKKIIMCFRFQHYNSSVLQ